MAVTQMPALLSHSLCKLVKSLWEHGDFIEGCHFPSKEGPRVGFICILAENSGGSEEEEPGYDGPR